MHWWAYHLGYGFDFFFLSQIIHFTSFAEMKKRDDHVLPPDDAGDFMLPDITASQGGFFRKGKI